MEIERREGRQKKAILEKASEITHSSEQYQLIHATYAARSMIKGMVMNYYKKRYDELSSSIAERLRKGLNIENQLKEKVELDALAKRSSFHVDVEYIDTKTEDMARVIRIENAFVINLPRTLAERIFDSNGDYDYEVIQKIRKLMAHELGHLILHTDELLRIDGTQGSRDLTDDEEEAEADYFGSMLIKLRRQRNEKFYQDKAYVTF